VTVEACCQLVIHTLWVSITTACGALLLQVTCDYQTVLIATGNSLSAVVFTGAEVGRPVLTPCDVMIL
jgi:hypothetical protein